jgi:Na+:H+ antiporter, NhaA family
VTNQPPDSQPSKLPSRPIARLANPASTALPVRSLPKAVREFIHTESSSGIVLLMAAAIALIWANSPYGGSYFDLWHTEIALELGSIRRTIDLQHFVNEALMALFFFVVGLEIKRELVVGELRSWKRAALPAFAALGGMVVPALLFLALNVGQAGSKGWGVPMATDIAFAVGVLALLGSRVPSNLKIFLLTLAIVDDIGAIVVIAVVYSGDVDLTALATAAGLLGLMGLLRRFRVDWMPAFVVLGLLVWAATYESGVHATIAGVLLGLFAPARPLAPSELAREWASDLADEPSPAELQAMTTMAKATVSVAERLEHVLHPVTSFIVIPLFALANAGVRIEGGALSAPGAPRVVLGVVVGLVVGKLVGISAFSWLAVRLRVGDLPEGVGGIHVAGAAAVAGIGFTVSLFIAGLAFDAPQLEAAAKVGILGASLVASVVGWALLRSAKPAST